MSIGTKIFNMPNSINTSRQKINNQSYFASNRFNASSDNKCNKRIKNKSFSQQLDTSELIEKLKSSVELSKTSNEFYKSKNNLLKKRYNNCKAFNNLLINLLNDLCSKLKLKFEQLSKHFYKKLDLIKEKYTQLIEKLIKFNTKKESQKKENDSVRSSQKNEEYWISLMKIGKQLRNNLKNEGIAFMQMHLPIYIKYNKKQELGEEKLKKIITMKPYSLSDSSLISVVCETMLSLKGKNTITPIKIKNKLRKLVGYYSSNQDFSNSKLCNEIIDLHNNYSSILKKTGKDERRERLCTIFERILSNINTSELIDKMKSIIEVIKRNKKPTKVLDLEKLNHICHAFNEFNKTDLDCAFFLEEYGIVKQINYINASPLCKAIKDVGLKYELEKKIDPKFIGQLYGIALYLKEKGLTLEQLFIGKMLLIERIGTNKKVKKLHLIKEETFKEVLTEKKIFFLGDKFNGNYGSILMQIKPNGNFLNFKTVNKIFDMFGINYDLCYYAHNEYAKISPFTIDSKIGEKITNTKSSHTGKDKVEISKTELFKEINIFSNYSNNKNNQNIGNSNQSKDEVNVCII